MTKLAYHVYLNRDLFGLKALLPAFILVIFTLQPCPTHANGPASSVSDPVYFTAGYAGNNLWNPGAEFGAGFLLYTFPVHSGKSRILERELFLLSSIGMYLDPGSHAAVYNQYGGSFRRTGSGGWVHSLEVFPVGIYRSFLAETWAVGEGTSPGKVFLPGRTYFAPGIGYQVGRFYSEERDRGWFTGFSMTLLMPYNTYVMPVFTIDLGWRFSSRKGGE
jgi:hypothetical protein